MRTRQFGCGIYVKASGRSQGTQEAAECCKNRQCGKSRRAKGPKNESLTKTERSARPDVSLMLFEAEGQLRERKVFVQKESL